MTPGWPEVARLRAFMDAGADPLGQVRPAVLEALAYDAIVEYGDRDGPGFTEDDQDTVVQRLVELGFDTDESQREVWDEELRLDPAVRAWFVSILPAGMVAAYQTERDLMERPFGLEPAGGPFHCGNCGTTAIGAHVRVVDRLDWLDDAVASAGDLVWCAPCVQAALREAA